MPLIVAAIFFLLVAGVTLLVVGLQGRRIDSHPLCKNCGFDLTGKPVDSTRCAECGADLTRPYATRRGHHEARRALVLIGSACTTLSVLAGTFLGVAMAHDYDFHPLFPTWYLLRTGDVASLNVVQKRLTANSLSAAQIQDIIAAALKAQADPNRPWLPQWGDLFEDADARGNVLPAQLQQYLRHCLPLTLAPDAVREDQGYLSFTVNAKARVGSSNRWWLQLTAPHPQRDDNYAADENVIGHAGAPLLNGGRITQTWLIRPDLDLTRGAPRKQSLHVRVPVKIFDNHVPGHVLAEWSEPLDGTWDLLPPLKPSAGASAGGAP